MEARRTAQGAVQTARSEVAQEQQVAVIEELNQRMESELKVDVMEVELRDLDQTLARARFIVHQS